MVNGKCRQGDSIIASDFIQSSHSSYITSSKCLTNMSKSIKTTTKITTTPPLTANNTATVLPHRKVFMITEKSGETDEQLGLTDKTTSGRKRKMILIMDEKPQGDVQRQNGNKNIKTESYKPRSYTNGVTAAKVDGAPKLLFFANSVDDQLSHKIEEILPEILSRIQWKNGRVVDGNDIQQQPQQQQQQQEEIQDNNINEKHQRIHGLMPEEYSDSSNSELAALSNNSNNSNLMLLGAAAAATAANRSTESMRRITLPPKKNHSKIQKQLVSSNGGTQIISAATPVIVSTTSLHKTMSNQINNSNSTITDIVNGSINNDINCHLQTNNRSNHTNLNGKMQLQQQSQQFNHQNVHRNNINHSHNKSNNNNTSSNITTNTTTNDQKNSIVVQQQNINLTGDFLFLMKMLPMLEKTPEPRKTQVKLLIEKIMKQCVTGDNPP